jgi:MoaA/NifB/PqqE/SkfB family radical SAM enzyme
MCDIWKEKTGVGLSVEEIRRWVPEWQRLGRPNVILCGEPLLHQDLWQICQLIREHGMAVELLSNGILLQRFAKEVVEHCDVLRVSLDGPPAIHNLTRGIPNAFGKLEAGVAAVRSVAPSFPISGRCAIHRLNFRHLPETVKAARKLGLDGISFSGTDLHNEEAFKRHNRIDGAYVESMTITGADLNELAVQLNIMREQCAADFATGFIADTPEQLDHMVLQYYRALAGEVAFPCRPCNAPWVSAIIEYNGVVRPCFPLDAYGTLAAHKTLEATLNSVQAKSLRGALDVENNPACQRCVCQTAVYV